MKRCITTKKELIEHIENNFPDEGLNIVLSNKFNFHTWLNIVFFSVVVSSIFILLMSNLLFHTPSDFLEFLKFGVFLFIPATISSFTVKFFEFRYKYQVK